MSLAIGGSSAPLRPAHGELWVDIRDYGAKADNALTDNSVPIQAAIDDLATKMTGLSGFKGVVFIPSAPEPYFVNKTIWVDQPDIEIRGEGWGSKVIMYGAFKHPVFLFGVRRTETIVVNGIQTPLQIDSTNRPDLFGILDVSAVTATGQRWGLRTNANSFAQFQANPMSAGAQNSLDTNGSDHWAETTKLTIEFCIEQPDGQQFPTNVPLLGMGVPGYQPAPFTVSIWDDPNELMVTFKTSDIPSGYNEGFRSFSISLAGVSGPLRIALQIDLDNASCSAFINGTQVAFLSAGNLSSGGSVPFTANTGVTFSQNDYYPFFIGAQGAHGPLFSTTSGIDLRLYGLRISNTIRYQNSGVGIIQTRSDLPSTPITAAYAYFTNDANTIAYLPLTDNPVSSGRVISVQCGNASSNVGIGSGLFLHTSNGGGVVGNAIKDISVEASYHGQAIAVGGVVEFTITNVQATGGYHGIGSVNMYANYNIYVSHCWLQGLDSAYYGALQLIYAHDLYCGESGRVTFRLLGSSANWQNVLVAFPRAYAECIFKHHALDYGGNHYISNVLVDFEGNTMSLAAIYCEAHGIIPATSLVIKDFFLGTVGSNAALVMLKDNGLLGNGLNRAWVSIENLQAFTNEYLAAVDVDGPLWHGEAKGVALNGPQFNHEQKWGTTTSIVIRDTKYVAPPRQYLWYSGAHLLEVRSPVDGQYSEWRCIVTGCYGTSTPPTWLGLNALNLAPNGLAAYVTNHGYMTVSLN